MKRVVKWVVIALVLWLIVRWLLSRYSASVTATVTETPPLPEDVAGDEATWGSGPGGNWYAPDVPQGVAPQLARPAADVYTTTRLPRLLRRVFVGGTDLKEDRGVLPIRPAPQPQPQPSDPSGATSIGRVFSRTGFRGGAV